MKRDEQILSDYNEKYLGLGKQFYFEFSCEQFEFIDFSQSFFKVTGYTNENINGKKGFFVASKQFQEKGILMIKNILETFIQKEYSRRDDFRIFFTYPLIFGDGTEHECLAKAEVILNDKKSISVIRFNNTLFDDRDDSQITNGISFINVNDSNSYYNITSKEEFIQCHAILTLSNREIEIIHLVSEGLSNADISERLNVSAHTISTHKKNIVKKTKTKNIMMTINLCLRMNLF